MTPAERRGANMLRRRLRAVLALARAIGFIGVVGALERALLQLQGEVESRRA